MTTSSTYPRLSLKWLIVLAALLPVASWRCWIWAHPKRVIAASMSLEAQCNEEELHRWLEANGARYDGSYHLIGQAWITKSGVRVTTSGLAIHFSRFAKQPRRSCREDLIVIGQDVERFILDHPNMVFGELSMDIIAIDPETLEPTKTSMSAPARSGYPLAKRIP